MEWCVGHLVKKVWEREGTRLIILFYCVKCQGHSFNLVVQGESLRH